MALKRSILRRNIMNYRKTTARRNRKGETKNSGNSAKRESVLRARVIRNNANASELLKLA